MSALVGIALVAEAALETYAVLQKMQPIIDQIKTMESGGATAEQIASALRDMAAQSEMAADKAVGEAT